MIRVTCFGAAGSVTGSNYYIETAQGNKVIVDCGLFQGGKEMERRNWEDWGFSPRDVTKLFLTHAHIDHSGRIPKLVRDGFQGEILTSHATADLCEIMLRDAAHVQEMDAEWQTKKNRRKGKREVGPLYTMADAEASLAYLTPLEEDKIIAVEPGMKVRLRTAGHILGASIIELWFSNGDEEVKAVFSGDIGRRNQLIVEDPQEIARTDYLFVESTYGNRLHRSFEDSREELLEAIAYAIGNNEKVIIPAFALERTQEILYLLGQFHRSGQLREVPVYLDSPLAIKATEIFRKHKDYYDEGARAIVAEGFDPFDMPTLKFTLSTEESIAINRKEGPAIIIAANGMCTAGRIKHHLKHNLWRPGASIVIVGFQAEGTTGRRIVDGADTVRIFGEDVAVKAKVFTIGGFSAHADQKGLLEWVGNFVGEARRPHVFVVHGEDTASSALRKKIQELYGLDVTIPRWKETLSLTPRQVISSGVPAEVIPEDKKRAGIEAVAALERELGRIKHVLADDGKDFADDDIERLRAVCEDLQGIIIKEKSKTSA
ncbi:MAG: MBL fold metallo-hydrolase [Deltaproteobacteria bacterium]|nr:MBL fold metallo-hydrolase [Deltaproteobacteria bacterium]